MAGLILSRIRLSSFRCDRKLNSKGLSGRGSILLFEGPAVPAPDRAGPAAPVWLGRWFLSPLHRFPLSDPLHPLCSLPCCVRGSLPPGVPSKPHCLSLALAGACSSNSESGRRVYHEELSPPQPPGRRQQASAGGSPGISLPVRIHPPEALTLISCWHPTPPPTQEPWPILGPLVMTSVAFRVFLTPLNRGPRLDRHLFSGRNIIFMP